MCGLSYTFILEWLSSTFEGLRYWIGDDGLVILVLAILAMGLAYLFHWSFGFLVSYVRNNLSARARNLFFGSWLSLLGFKIKTCIASVIFASAIYILLKGAVRFPAIWHVWLYTFIAVVVAFSVAGWWVSGKVKPMNFVKHYYIPALCGVLFFAFNVALDITINLIGAVFTLLAA